GVRSNLMRDDLPAIAGDTPLTPGSW
ncbi:MAG: hypothetical protein XD69_1439, partial [Clostridia bacterium 62_21]